MTALYPEATPEQRAEYDAKLATIRARDAPLGGAVPGEPRAHAAAASRRSARASTVRASKRPTSTTARSRPRAPTSYLNIEALAAELAARFWLRDGKPEFARIYLDKAAARLRGVGRDRQGRRSREPSMASVPRAARRCP